MLSIVFLGFHLVDLNFWPVELKYFEGFSLIYLSSIIIMTMATVFNRPKLSSETFPV